MRFTGSAPTTPIADATTPGSLSVVAQVIAGVKTFTSAIVAAAGIQLAALWNTNGTGASDVCLKVGSSVADGSVDAAAKLLSVRTGIGATETESFYFLKGGYLGSGVGGLRFNGAFGASLIWNYSQLTLDAAQLTVQSIYGQALLIPFATGNLELATVGAGVILKSPDGARYKLTVANGGALSVVAV